MNIQNITSHFSDFARKVKPMFWETFYEACRARGKSPNSVARELGISSGAVTSWKQGSTPHYSTLSSIAKYLGISVEKLLGRAEEGTQSNVFVERILETMQEQGVSRSELLSDLQMGKNQFKYWERGQVPNRSTVDAIADYLHVSADYLIGDTDDPVNYDDGDVLASVPLSYVEAPNGDMRKAYKLMHQVDEDAQRDIAAHYPLDTYTDQEKAIISAFRSVNDYSKLRIIQAVMNIKDDCNSEGIKVYRAARSNTDIAPTVETMSPEDLRKYQSAKKVTSEEDL